MSKQIQEAYIVAATRTPIGRSHKGYFRNTRPDDLLAAVLRSALAQAPGLDPKAIEDVICGCAIPEAQQGLNVARIGAILAGLPNTVGGITVNRFCASGLSAVQMAADRIRVGEAEVMIAAGVESMSMVPMMGNSPSLSPAIFANTDDVENYGIAYGMGLTAEKVAQQWKVSQRGAGRFCGGVAPPRRGRDEGRGVHRRDHAGGRDRALGQPGDGRGQHEPPAPSTWTRALARTPRSKAWPSCARYLPRAARSRPATAPRRRTAPAR
jgi:hypothetical protein